jgi:phosphomannomutase
MKIKFGTDGWRAIIAKEFTTENVARVSQATAKWLNKNNKNTSVVIGHDCRFAGDIFAETSALVLCQAGIKVYMSKGFVSTPMISLGAVQLKATIGIIITASHNPPAYNGFKLKGGYGGPLLPEQVQEIEDIIEDKANNSYEEKTLAHYEKEGLLEYVDLETMYLNHVEKNFDLDLIRNSNLSFAYDAMYGAGQNIMRRLFPDITFLHCEHNPGFDGQAPEPIHKNLLEFSEMIAISQNIDCGLVTDGDADRIGLYDSKGNFVDSHHIILLLIHYMYKYKNMRGKVCTAFSTTVKIKNMCEHYGLELDVVKIGFKYICGIMLKDDVLLGGEESGGIAIKGHIPERDGIWMGLTLWEFMAKSGKSLEELIDEVYAITGKFWFERNDLHLDNATKDKIVANCKNNTYKSFGNYAVERVEDLDGWKYFINNNEWIMIRASGTEPVLRTYAESSTKEKAFALLDACKKTLLG